MGKTLSFGKGKGSIGHNNREYITENVDKDRISNNVTYIKQDLTEAYRECFGSAIDQYNSKQKRADRRKSIEGYIDEIKRNQSNRNGEKLFYEQVVGIGDMWDSGILTKPEEARKCADALDAYAKTFQERNPNLHVFNMTLHMDEQTPHLHIDYIPVGEGYKQGLQVRNSLTKAFDNMGIESSKTKDDNSTMAWQRRERTYLTEIAKERGIEIDVLGEKRKDLSLSEYKALVRNQRQMVRSEPEIVTQRVKLPFNLGLELDRKGVDRQLKRKHNTKQLAVDYETAIERAEHAFSHGNESVKAMAGLMAELKVELDQEKLIRMDLQEKLHDVLEAVRLYEDLHEVEVLPRQQEKKDPEIPEHGRGLDIKPRERVMDKDAKQSYDDVKRQLAEIKAKKGTDRPVTRRKPSIHNHDR